MLGSYEPRLDKHKYVDIIFIGIDLVFKSVHVNKIFHMNRYYLIHLEMIIRLLCPAVFFMFKIHCNQIWCVTNKTLSFTYTTYKYTDVKFKTTDSFSGNSD